MKRAGLVGLLVIAIALVIWIARRGDRGASPSPHRREVQVAPAPRWPPARLEDRVNGSEEEEMELDGGGTIAGVVMDEQGPVAGVAVTADPDDTDPERHAITDSDGAFEFSGLNDVPFELTATRRPVGGASWSYRRVRARIGDRDVRITFVRDGELTGRIVLADANAAPRDVTVSLDRRQGGGANSDGSFHLKGLRPGSYDVVFQSHDFAVFGRRDVRILPGATTDLGTVTAARGRTLTGRVVNTSGAPISAAQIDIGVIRLVSVGDGDGDGDRDPSRGFRVYRSVWTKRDGTFRIELSPEPLTVIASDPEYSNSAAAALPGDASDPPPITLVLSDDPDDR